MGCVPGGCIITHNGLTVQSGGVCRGKAVIKGAFISSLYLFKEYKTLEGTACYAGLLLTPAEALAFGQCIFGLRPILSWPSANPILAKAKAKSVSCVW